MKWIGVVSLMFVIGCAAPIKTLTKTQYVSQDFSADQLRNGGLALLPITADAERANYSRPLAEQLNINLPMAVPSGKTLTWQMTMDSLGKSDMISGYQEMVRAYQETSILDRERWKGLASALNIRFALYCALQDYSQKGKASFDALTGYSHVETAKISAHCILVDLTSGNIVQEIAGEASTATSSQTLAPTPEYEAFAEKLALSILQQIPGSAVITKKPQTTTPSRRY